MVDTAMRCRITRMAIQAVGRVTAQGDGVNHFLSRAVMTGGTGAGPVGGHVMLGAVNLAPSRHHVTNAAGRPAGQVSGSQFYSMAVAIMDCIPRGSMAGGAIGRRRVTGG